jgi:carboxylesterase type B
MTDKKELKIPSVKPIKLKDFECSQSKYDNVEKLPLRSLIVGSSGGGKSILLQNMILDIYKNCFSRVYIWSPSIHIDHTWEPVKKYVYDNIKIGKDEECFFDHYNSEDLENVIETQKKVIKYMKDNDHKKLYQILVVIDDFADVPEFTRNSKLLWQLYIRGRHLMISSITSTQVFRQISPIIRKNLTSIYLFKMRNQSDLEAVLEEMSAIADKKTLHNLYKKIIKIPHNFFYINLMNTNENMFHHNFNKITDLD